jgi:hypothetical protein
MLATANAPAKPAGIQTLGILDAIAKPAAKQSKAKNYPAIPDPDGQVSGLADHFAAELEQWKALDASIATAKAELTALGRQAYYIHNQGKMEATSSVEAHGRSSTVLVTFQNRYSGSASSEAVTAIIGPEDAARYFYQTFSLKIDGDKLPADRAPEIIAGIHAVLAGAGCADALSASAAIRPTGEYHAARHQWDTETNLKLDRLIPPVAVVRIKK